MNFRSIIPFGFFSRSYFLFPTFNFVTPIPDSQLIWVSLLTWVLNFMVSLELYRNASCRRRMQSIQVLLFPPPPPQSWTLWLWFFFIKAMWTFAITCRLSSVVCKCCNHEVHAQHSNISAPRVIISMLMECGTIKKKIHFMNHCSVNHDMWQVYGSYNTFKFK